MYSYHTHRPLFSRSGDRMTGLGENFIGPAHPDRPIQVRAQRALTPPRCAIDAGYPRGPGNPPETPTATKRVPADLTAPARGQGERTTGAATGPLSPGSWPCTGAWSMVNDDENPQTSLTRSVEGRSVPVTLLASPLPHRWPSPHHLTPSAPRSPLTHIFCPSKNASRGRVPDRACSPAWAICLRGSPERGWRLRAFRLRLAG